MRARIVVPCVVCAFSAWALSCAFAIARVDCGLECGAVARWFALVSGCDDAQWRLCVERVFV